MTSYSKLTKHVLYVGAAPAHYAAFLSSLFPDVKFTLIDENKMLAKPGTNVTLIEKKFTKEMCELYAKDVNKYLLISSLNDLNKLQVQPGLLSQKDIEVRVAEQIAE